MPGEPTAEVAVIGASGFQGRHLLQVLAARGIDVRAICRRVPDAPHARHVPLDVQVADAHALAGAIEGCRAVVNLIGIKMEQGGTFQEMHVGVVEKLVAACHEAKVRRFVHVSALVERDLHAYHRTKLEGEAVVRASGLDWSIVRPAVVWGPGDDFVRNLDALASAAVLMPVPKDAAPVSPVWIGDVSEATARVLERDDAIGRAYDVAGPEQAPLAHWVRVVAGARGLSVRVVPVPSALMTMGAAVFEAFQRDPLVTRGQVQLLSGGMSGAPDDLHALGIRPRALDAEGVREVLDTTGKPTPLHLRWTRRWDAPGRALSIPAVVALVAVVLGLHVGARIIDLPVSTWSAFIVAVVLSAGVAWAAARGGILGIRRVDLPVGIVLGVLPYLVYLGLRSASPFIAQRADELMSWPPEHGGLFLAATVAIGVLAEELLWRGVVLAQFAKRLSVGAAAGLAAILQGAIHVPSGDVVLVSTAVAFGLFWGLLAVATRRLGLALVAHASFDALLWGLG